MKGLITKITFRISNLKNTFLSLHLNGKTHENKQKTGRILSIQNVQPEFIKKRLATLT